MAKGVLGRIGAWADVALGLTPKKGRKAAAGRRGEVGRFVTLKTGRVIFIPKGYRGKWADVKDKTGAEVSPGRAPAKETGKTGVTPKQFREQGWSISEGSKWTRTKRLGGHLLARLGVENGKLVGQIRTARGKGWRTIDVPGVLSPEEMGEAASLWISEKRGELPYREQRRPKGG